MHCSDSRKARRIVLAAFGLAVVAGCHRSPGSSTNTPIELIVQVDSVEYHVRVNGPLYETSINFAARNSSGRTMSANGCGGPPSPHLEKQRPTGEWTHAYAPIELSCLTRPPFRLLDGATYAGTFKLTSGRPGTNVLQTFAPDSVPGPYRLRWELRTGEDPDDPRARPVIGISAPFRLIMP